MSEPFPNDDINIDEIVDDNGEVRRLGSLAPPEGFVSSFQDTLFHFFDLLSTSRLQLRRVQF